VIGGEEPKGVAGRGTEQARSFHRAAAEYDRGRPGWPPPLLDLLPLERDATVLDLGAGTGKLTQILVDRYSRVIAVEPLDELRAILAERVPQADVRAGVAEEIPLADAEVDGVFAGQAFHWFANDAAVAEIARVLRPGGVIALLWNRALEPSPLPADYRARLERLHDERRPAATDEDILVRSGFFGDETEEHVDHEQVSARDDVLAFAASVSWIAMRNDREEILTELSRMLPPGEYRFTMRANVAWAIRN
jgi:SAM-dependent methyltransferase